MKKKLFAVLVVAMVLLTACGGSKNDSIEPEVDTTVDIQSESASELKTKGDKDAEPEATVNEDKSEDVANEDKSKTVEDDTKPETTAEPETAEDDKQEEETADSENYATLEEYWNEPDVRAEIENLYASMEDETMAILCNVQVNNFIIEYKFLDSSMVTDDMSEAFVAALTKGLEENADTFKSVAASFDEEVGFEEGTCTLTVRYTDLDDHVLAERTFGND